MDYILDNVSSEDEVLRDQNNVILYSMGKKHMRNQRHKYVRLKNLKFRLTAKYVRKHKIRVVYGDHRNTHHDLSFVTHYACKYKHCYQWRSQWTPPDGGPHWNGFWQYDIDYRRSCDRTCFSFKRNTPLVLLGDGVKK